MKFSTKTRYGLRAMMEIANSDQKTGIFQKDIAANQDISLKYLDHIIHALKVAGLITNVRGKKSGYILTKSPSKITVFDIHSAFEPGICVIDCLSRNIKCERENICAAKGFWGKLNNQIVTYFKTVTLKELINEQTNLDDGSPIPCC
ncbi:RrF2 family transcriptional regulator [Saccharicrinis sp. FJH62]|uniref:RrF2 family transcriptional regulator n=1 Tax=Saccharicrinis sp. FJH62 TaxID=3344657 RepID=UPI0035D4B72D